jgi:Zn-dependent peptidase ImmA (M78 family)/transcriptional regulator with XRE-family HTH domain
MISKYENEQAMPNSATLMKLADVLGVRLDYFFRENTVSLETPVFRKQPGLSASQARAIESEVQEHVERYLELLALLPSFHEQYFTSPKSLPECISSLEEVEDLADGLRAEWNLGTNPIPNLADVLEEHGLLVVTVETTEDSKFDGLATAADGHCILVVNKLKPGDRQRFTLAHELAHILLDDRFDGTVDIERACNRFAGAFLVPRERVIAELGEHRKHLGWRELFMLKHEWGLSMAAWLHRAREAKVLSDSRYQTHRREFESKQWLTEEPGKQVASEKPTRFRQLVERAVAEEYISEGKGAEFLQQSASEFRKSQKDFDLL